jgi:hypothetical protein
MEAYVIGKGGNPRRGKAALPKLHHRGRTARHGEKGRRPFRR